MKGKKIDTDFVSQYISESIENNITSSDDIAKRAKERISFIDEKIREVERMKVERAKLLDVILTFQKPIKSTNIEENKLLSFYKIVNHNVCAFVCSLLRDKPVGLESLLSNDYAPSDIIFAVKQLIENKIVYKNGEYFSRGEMFDYYCEFVLKT